GLYRETSYGPQLEIRKIRLVIDSDRGDGFDPGDYQARSRFDSQEMFDELTALVAEKIARPELRALVLHLLMTHREELLRLAVAECASSGDRPVDAETLLRLEHIIVSHQRLPEWGSPKPPMTPEALLVHYADDMDAKFQMMFEALADDTMDGPLTSKNNALRQ